MEPLLLVLVPGIIGGLVVALVASRMRGPRSSVDPLRNVPRQPTPSTCRPSSSPVSPWIIMPLDRVTGYYRLRSSNPRLIYHRHARF